MGNTRQITDGPARYRASGFTLLELLVTIAVAAVLLAIAIPSYRGMVQRNALVANVNDLVGDLNYARAEAVTRGQNVYVCSSSNQSTCSNDGNWSAGWLIYVDDDFSASSPKPSDSKILRSRGRAGSGFTLTTDDTSVLAFNSSGFAPDGNRTFNAASNDGNQKER